MGNSQGVTYGQARQAAQKTHGSVDRQILSDNRSQAGGNFSTTSMQTQIAANPNRGFLDRLFGRNKTITQQVPTDTRKTAIEIQSGQTVWDLAEALYRDHFNAPDAKGKELNQQAVYKMTEQLLKDNGLDFDSARKLKAGQELKIAGVDNPGFISGLKTQYGL